MFNRLSIFALTLVLTLGILLSPRWPAKTAARTSAQWKTAVLRSNGPAQKKNTRTRTNASFFQNGVAIAIRCPKDAHTHIDGKCYITVYGDCKHVHDADCGYVAPEPEQPAASSGSNFLEPTYYADYEEDVVYLDPDAAEAADYAVTCRTLNVRKTPSTEYAPIAQIHRGDIVSVVDWEGDWAKIEWVSAEDGYAYVFGAYIEKL